MGISEMQLKFNAYGSGELPEIELRNFIRSALTQEPQLSSALVALTDAYRRANLIDANLQTMINADIAAVSAQNQGLTMVRWPGFPGPDSGWIAADRAANSTDLNFPAGGLTGPMEPMAPMAPLAPMARSSARKSPAKGPTAPGGNTARSEMSVSVQVVRSCTVQPSGTTAAVDCGSTVPASMRIGVAQPAPESTTTGGPSGPQVVTIEF